MSNAATALSGPVRNSRLSEEVLYRIDRLVAEGGVQLNGRFPSERALQEAWQVSRPVLREAFRILEMQGIIESRPGGGRFLRSLRVLDPARLRAGAINVDRALLLQIWEAREAVEITICELAAVRRTEDQLARIERPLLEAAVADIVDLASLDLNGEFHRAVAAACDNPVLEELSERLVRQSAQTGFRGLVGERTWAALQGEHRPIFEAIRDGDSEAARQAMRRHFANLRERLL